MAAMLLIKNATVSKGKGDETEEVDIVVDGGLVFDVCPAGSFSSSCDDTIDASGLIVIPGAVDPHVHFDTPGFTEREDFTCGSMAAAVGGVTCVIDMPDTCTPPVTDRARLNSKLKVIEGMSVVDFALWGGMTGGSYQSGDWQARIKGLWQAGVVGIKCYLLSGMRTFEHMMPLELIEFMRFAKEAGVLVGLHAEDRETVSKRMAGLQTQGRFDAKAYYESRCDPAELEGIKLGLTVASSTGGTLHIVHVGSGEGAAEVVKAKAQGLDVTMETCIHYLAFTFEDFVERGAILKTSPVVKTKEDQKRLWGFLADGGIDFLASDHAPCTNPEKATASIWTDYAGMPGTELMLPYAFSEGFKKGKISLARLVEATSQKAAARYGLYPRKGAIQKGSDADLVFIDPEKKHIVKSAELHSRGKITPFEGTEFQGKVVRTMCRGTTVYTENDGICVKPGFGKFVKRSQTIHEGVLL